MTLERNAAHYHYEVRMLVSATTHFVAFQQSEIPGIGPGTRDLLYNSLLETILLHARVLIEFHVPRMSDDITPAEFLQAEVKDDALVKRLREHKNKIDKRLVHLTSARNKDFSGWEVVALVADVLDAVERFLADVGQLFPDRLEWFAPALEAHETFFRDFGAFANGNRPAASG